MEHFRTARLVVRDWTAADLEASFAIHGRVEVARWVFPPPGRPVASLAQMQRMLDRRVTRSQEHSEYGMWAVELQATSQVIGAVLLRPLRADRAEVEVGWHLNPDYWGAGYYPEAGCGVVALAFGLDRVNPEGAGPGLASPRARPVLDRVVALVDPENIRSQRVCRRLGMRHLGQTGHDDRTLELFELTRAELG